MAEAARAWRPEGAWDGILSAGHRGEAGAAGLVVDALESVSFATLQAAPGAASRLDASLSSALGIRLPAPGTMTRGPDLDLVWSGPENWLAVSGLADMPARLAEAAGEDGTVVPAAGSRALLHLGGPAVREALAKGCPLDLHPASFPAGAAAVTAIAHMGVQLWRPHETGFCLAVSRSYAGSLWSWLANSGAEFGIRVNGS